MSEQNITVLAQGKVQFEHGPISMVLSAWENGKPLNGLLREACGYAAHCLRELSEQLPLLKKPWLETSTDDFYGIAVTLRQAVEKTGDKTFTPMAAVAGTVSEFTANFLAKGGATRAIVNNGGDIALRMTGDDVVTVGIISSIAPGSDGISRVLTLRAADGIFGICTSGLGGRSFTRGVADAVTVLAENCSVADVYATLLANETYIASPSVRRELASHIDPNSDIAGLTVTTSVERLTPAEIDMAFSHLREASQRGFSAGHIKRVYAYIQGVELILDAAGS